MGVKAELDAKDRMLTVQQVAFSTYLYSCLSTYHRSYNEIRLTLSDDPELARAETGEALLAWLNSWGCRLAKADFETGIRELTHWYGLFREKLSFGDADLLTLTKDQLDSAVLAVEGVGDAQHLGGAFASE